MTKCQLFLRMLLLVCVLMIFLIPSSQAADCGDIDCNGTVAPDMTDLARLIDYLMVSHDPLCDPTAANMDGVAGVTNNDLLVLIDNMFLTLQPLDCTGNDPDYPESDDLVEFRYAHIPPNETTWDVEVWVHAQSDYGGLSLVFNYDCATSPVTINNIQLDLSAPDSYTDWDNVGQTAAVLVVSSSGNTFPGGSHKFATIEFTVNANTDLQHLDFVFAAHPPEHQTVLSRWGGDGVEGTLPKHLACGNTNADGANIVDIGDMIEMVDYLYQSMTLPDGYAAADMDNVLGVTHGDFSTLIDHLYITFPPLNCEPQLAEYPYLGDIVEFRHVNVPPGNDTWDVEMWLDAPESFAGFSLPISWEASDDLHELASISLVLTGNNNYDLFDNSIDRAMPAVMSFSNKFPAGDNHVATFTFSVPVMGVPQTIELALSDYPPSHEPLITRVGSKGATSYTATLKEQCSADGDFNGDMTVDIVDLVSLVGFLFQGTVAPDPLYRMDVKPDCVLDTFDILELANWLYLSGIPAEPIPTCCEPEVWVPGEEAKRLGDAIVTIETKASGRVLVEQVVDNDGVRLYTDDVTSEGYRMAVENVDLSQEDAALNLELRGRVVDADSTVLQMLAGVGVASTGSGLGTAQIYADFRPIGDTTVWVQTWQTSTMIDQDTLTQYGVIAIVEDVGFGLPHVVAVDMFATDPPAFRILFSNIAGFHLVNDSVYQGSEIRLIASQSTKEIVDLYALDIIGSALGWFALSGFTKDACCRGFTGNVDDDPTDFVDIGDLTALIDFLFISFTEPNCMMEGQIDGADDVDNGDLTRLIQFLFIDYVPPEVCPEE